MVRSKTRDNLLNEKLFGFNEKNVMRKFIESTYGWLELFVAWINKLKQAGTCIGCKETVDC